jgi:hypothetical protein
MEIIVAELVNEAPEHEAFPNSSKYDLRALRVNWTHDATTLEIEVSTHETYKTFRFSGVEDLYIPGGELISSTLLSVKNTANCQNTAHYIKPIRVGGTSKDGHVLKFWASSIEELENR